MTSPHDEIARAILEVITPHGGELRLLGRLADPVIENASEREIFFFVPDLHMLSPERTKKFGAYRTGDRCCCSRQAVINPSTNFRPMNRG
jgi:hypothetical protein